MGSRPPSSRGQALRGNNGDWGTEMTGRAGGLQEQRMEGWVPASARTRKGEREEGWWIGGVAAGTAFEYNGLLYTQIPVV